MKSEINIPELKYEGNSPYFEEQPAGTRVAVWEDFITGDNKQILNKPYLIQSELHKNRFWAFRTHPGFTRQNDFFTFLIRGRVLVFEN